MDDIVVPAMDAADYRASVEGVWQAHLQRQHDDLVLALGALGIVILLALAAMMIRARRPRLLWSACFATRAYLVSSFAALTASHRALLLFAAIGLVSMWTLGVLTAMILQH